MIKGYKVFNPDWTCRDKQYTCPGTFIEEGELELCDRGMHFCEKLIDCFNYYSADPNNKVAEVIAYNEVIRGEKKCCTNNLEIVREIPWDEVLKLINVGTNCSGIGNTGSDNNGNYNSGNYNLGYGNTGNFNAGDWNVGNRNGGDSNIGSNNAGSFNIGNHNEGSWNIGDNNTGNKNFGSWNTCSYSFGYFNTNSNSSTLWFFNKPSNITYKEWLNSRARAILTVMPKETYEKVSYKNMTDQEREDNPEVPENGWFLRLMDNSDRRRYWWSRLSDTGKKAVMSMPNFDKEIFKEITGIDVDDVDEKEAPLW